MTRLHLPSLLIAALVLAGGLTSLTGCAEAQRMVNDAGRIVDTAGGAGIITTTVAGWRTDAQNLRGRSGTFAFDCPAADISSDAVYGSNPYTDDSSVCFAGVHAGAISRNGGRVLIQPRPGQTRYAGTRRNGVVTRDWNSYDGSFAVVTN